tara:strand:+ start:309 stop:524 length:216 start_codon:yes stop_codon:yes gene_type:complete
LLINNSITLTHNDPDNKKAYKIDANSARVGVTLRLSKQYSNKGYFFENYHILYLPIGGTLGGDYRSSKPCE